MTTHLCNSTQNQAAGLERFLSHVFLNVNIYAHGEDEAIGMKIRVRPTFLP
jgi:hypothetical protein